MHEKLQTGGKLIVQFREDKNKIPAELLKKSPVSKVRQLLRKHMLKPKEVVSKTKVEIMNREAEGAEGTFGKFAEKGEKIPVIEDTDKGDAFYFYGFENYGTDDDGIESSVFSKAYIDENGEEHDLGAVKIMSYIESNNFQVLKRMMEEAGFRDARLELENLSDDGSYQNCIVVGKK